MEDGKSRDWRGAFSFLGDIMGDILSSAMTYSKLLDIEYQLVLGRKNKTLALSIYFDENQFFHLAGLQYLTDRATLLYGDRSYLFQKILSGSITREQIESSSFYSEIKENKKTNRGENSFFILTLQSFMNIPNTINLRTI